MIMDEFKVIEIKKSVFENNDREADRIRERLKKEHTFLLNLMSSPGSGKTTTLKATISRLKDEMKIGVMEADIDSSVDAKAIAETGVKSIQLHTLGMCHLDAGMTEQGIDEFGTDELDLVVLENVGNLVCPAEFDTGAVKNAMILSFPKVTTSHSNILLCFQFAMLFLLIKSTQKAYLILTMTLLLKELRSLTQRLKYSLSVLKQVRV
jgi:hydrogenase nickel incorporation protein HypB